MRDSVLKMLKPGLKKDEVGSWLGTPDNDDSIDPTKMPKSDSFYNARGVEMCGYYLYGDDAMGPLGSGYEYIIILFDKNGIVLKAR